MGRRGDPRHAAGKDWSVPRYGDLSCRAARDAGGRAGDASRAAGAFDDMPAALPWRCSDDTVKNAAQQPKQLEELTEAYLQGDPDLLYRAARAQYAKMPPALVAMVYRAGD